MQNWDKNKGQVFLSICLKPCLANLSFVHAWQVRVQGCFKLALIDIP